MKSSITLLSVTLATCIAAVGCSSSNSSAKQSAGSAQLDDTPVAGREAVLVVYGMSCPLCANNVDQTLLEVPGVTAVDVDMSTGKAHVTLDGQTRVTRRQLAQAVDKSGFTLRSVEAR